MWIAVDVIYVPLYLSRDLNLTALVYVVFLGALHPGSEAVARSPGLVLGKFLPPHAGHHELVDFALAHCDALTVLVLGSAAEDDSAGAAARLDARASPAARGSSPARTSCRSTSTTRTSTTSTSR